QIGRQPQGCCTGADLVDHLLVAPGHARLLLGGQFQLPGPLHIAEALGDEINERPVDAVDFGAHRGHVAAFGGRTGGHGELPAGLGYGVLGLQSAAAVGKAYAPAPRERAAAPERSPTPLTPTSAAARADARRRPRSPGRRGRASARRRAGRSAAARAACPARRARPEWRSPAVPPCSR